MKSAFLFLFTILSFSGFSQISFDTGSKDLDADLNSINVNAEADLGIFKADLSADFNLSEKKIDYMFSVGMQAGEVYLACEISNIGGKSIDDVVDCYKSNKGKGWGYIAKEMGIKPGSDEFHQLKGKSKNKKDKGKPSKSSGNKGSGSKKGKGTLKSKSNK